jgi:hypothetical protein
MTTPLYQRFNDDQRSASALPIADGRCQFEKWSVKLNCTYFQIGNWQSAIGNVKADR